VSTGSGHGTPGDGAATTSGRGTAPMPVRVTARLRLALSYAVFLVAAGAIVLFGVYVVLRYVPNYPLTASDPSDYGLPIASRGDILRAVVGVSGVMLLALAIIGIVGGWYLAGWILKPLRRINEAAVIASGGDLEHRIGLVGRNDEFRQLADSFDHMLDRVHDTFEVYERFAANASHELRTPLAVTATMLDVARRNPEGQDYAVLIERLRLTNDRAIGLTEALLRLADVNAINSVAAPVDLARILGAVVAENSDYAAERDVTLVSQLEPARVHGDAGLLAQLATNLVRNAIQHGDSPGTATVSTVHNVQRGVIELRVESSGTIFSEEGAARLAEPFLRGAGRVVAGEHRGYGLGLALVSRITDVHGGTLVIRPRILGGLVVRVELPALAAGD